MLLIFTHRSSLLKKCTSLDVSLGKHLFSTSPFVLFRVWVANDQIWLTCLFVRFPVDHLTIYFFSSPCKSNLIKSDVWNSGILSRNEFDVNVIFCIFCDLFRTTVVKLKTVSCFKSYINLCEPSACTRLIGTFLYIQRISWVTIREELYCTWW